VLAVWEARFLSHWSDIAFASVDARAVDGVLHVVTEVALGHLPPEEVRIELFADADGEAPPTRVPLCYRGPTPGRLATFRFTAAVATPRPAAHFTRRVVPNHPDARVPLELPLIRWPE
jgi:glycogen phosphorylase